MSLNLIPKSSNSQVIKRGDCRDLPKNGKNATQIMIFLPHL